MRKIFDKSIVLSFMVVMTALLSSCGFPSGSGRVSEYYREAEVLVGDVEKAAEASEIRNNSYTDLSIPAQIQKIGDTYFIVDCYHDQVIYSDSLGAPLSEWRVMTDEMSRGHTIAGDGQVYLIDDTENERIMVFEKARDRFVFSRQFTGITGRPHYIIYDEASKTFYAWCSVSGEMYLIKHDEGRPVYICDKKTVPELDGIYVRSFTIIGDDIYFVSGNSSIIRADLDTFRIKDRYPVPSEMAGMVQLTPIDGMYYITISTDDNWNQDYATIIRCDSLEGLSENKYEDIYSHFIGGGTPYYITSFDGSYYLTEHRIPGHSIWRFNVNEGEITAETLY
ncbi:MAG: hypothetical protein IJT24_07675 [Lachnospiraceae bacterium]|nr:hypothetical protein [Lachnospiraceae bacterium]